MTDITEKDCSDTLKETRGISSKNSNFSLFSVEDSMIDDALSLWINSCKTFITKNITNHWGTNNNSDVEQYRSDSDISEFFDSLYLSFEDKNHADAYDSDVN